MIGVSGIQDEREEVIFKQQKVFNDADEYFEEIKKETDEKRAEREQQWAEKELSEKERAEQAEARWEPRINNFYISKFFIR